MIDHYIAITEPTGEPTLSDFRATLDNRLNPGGNWQRQNLTDTEKQQREAFFAVLTGTNVWSDPPWPDPF